MDANRQADLIGLGPRFSQSRARVRQATFIVTGTAFLTGIVASTRDPRWALLFAAVVLGWSKIGSV